MPVEGGRALEGIFFAVKKMHHSAAAAAAAERPGLPVKYAYLTRWIQPARDIHPYVQLAFTPTGRTVVLRDSVQAFAAGPPATRRLTCLVCMRQRRGIVCDIIVRSRGPEASMRRVKDRGRRCGPMSISKSIDFRHLQRCITFLRARSPAQIITCIKNRRGIPLFSRNLPPTNTIVIRQSTASQRR
jgi:hypothetical protein